MKVLLKKPLPPHGRAGDIISVSDSYARNALLPKGIAVIATASAIAAADRQQQQTAAHHAQLQQQHEELRTRLQGNVVQLSGRANANGKLYAALQGADVLRSLHEQFGVPVTGLRCLGLPIKTTGEHQITIVFPNNQEATVQATVTPLP